MSPARFSNDEQARREINGARPSPLRLNGDSHLIQKPSSSSLYPRQQNPTANTHQHRSPVIIYTHSPKIIHTQARDFMALVQKLTGLTRSDRHGTEQQEHDHDKLVSHEVENESSSALTTSGGSDGGDVKESSASVSPMFSSTESFLADIPLFTPNWNDFFRSPRPMFKYTDMLSPSTNMANSMQPPV